MLIRLLRTHLRPYRRLLLLTVFLQAVQTVAALALPTLNASIIDNGVLKHNQAYIRSSGMEMIGFTLIQGAFSTAAVYFGAKVAMSFGRDVRAALFHQVTGYSAREVGAFGAPSLITRITNDVQQVQMLVVMTCTMAIGAPITLRRRDHPGPAPGCRAVVGARREHPHRRHRAGSDRVADGARLPRHAGPHRRDQPGAARADHRHPGGPGLRARAPGDPPVRHLQR